MGSCRECCYAALTGANLYCSINDCYVGELTCDDFEPIVKAKTNYDRIVRKSPEEMAGWFNSYFTCPPKTTCPMGEASCEKCWLEYLKREVEE